MQEDLMKIGNPRSTRKTTSPKALDELLDCRMAMLGLSANEIGDGDAFDEIRRRCMSCGYREACAVDLQRDPNRPRQEHPRTHRGAVHAARREDHLSGRQVSRS